mgnify:CR=1 FL=1
MIMANGKCYWRGGYNGSVCFKKENQQTIWKDFKGN